MNTEAVFINDVLEVIERYATAKGTTVEDTISEILVKLSQADRHPVHISKSTHKVTLNMEAIRKLIWNDEMEIRSMAELTGLSVNTLRRIATSGGRVWAKTAWKLATGFNVPIETICNIDILKGVVTGWEDTRQEADQKEQ